MPPTQDGRCYQSVPEIGEEIGPAPPATTTPSSRMTGHASPTTWTAAWPCWSPSWPPRETRRRPGARGLRGRGVDAHGDGPLHRTGPDDWVRLRHRAPIPELDAAVVATLLAEALEIFHRRSVAHRDVKPDNVLLDAYDDGDGPVPLCAETPSLAPAGPTASSPADAAAAAARSRFRS